MSSLRFPWALAVAGWLASVPVSADVVLSGGSSYSYTPTYTTSGSSVSISQTGGGLQFLSTVVPTGTTPAYAVAGALNTSLTYNPATQGPIQSITASVSKNLSVNIAGGPGYSIGNAFFPMIEQDGNYYLASIPGPSFPEAPPDS